MSRLEGQAWNLFVCILGLTFDAIAIAKTFINLTGGILYFLFILQIAAGIYLLYAAGHTLRVIWVEWRWQPAKFR